MVCLLAFNAYLGLLQCLLFDLLKGLFGGKSLIASVAMSSLIKGRMRVYMNVGTYISVCVHKHAHAHAQLVYFDVFRRRRRISFFFYGAP